MAKYKMQNNQKYQRKRRPQRKRGIAGAVQLIRKMNWRGKAIVFGGAALVVAAIVVAVVLATGTGAAAEQTSMAAMTSTSPLPPSPSLSPLPTPTPTPLPTTPPEPTPDPMLQEGDENERVMALQNRLMDLGYLDIDQPTEYYGSATEYAVSLFQRQHELQQDGIAGQETLIMIYSPDAKPYTLLQGTKGEDVDSLQRQLVRLGYLDKVTKYYGTETEAAVRAFQERNDLTVDGKTGQHTLDVIYSPKAKAHPNVEKEIRREANINEVLTTAEAQLGKPYILGNEGPNSFDCSGLVYYCLREAGSSRGRYNAAGYSQVTEWDKITSFNDLEKGDLLFFKKNGRVYHVGIYVGNGLMIDASSSKSKVVKRDCHWSTFVFARRPY